MTLETPIWLEYVKAFSTPIIAIVAAFITGTIAHRQWKTANDKLVLDLFQRRLECLEEIKAAILRAMQVDLVDNGFEALQLLARGRNKANYLFGKDVNKYLEDLWNSIIKLRTTRRQIQRANETDLDRLSDEDFEHSEMLDKFFDNIDPIVTPYLRMDQKLSRYQKPWYKRLRNDN